jgi:hypothetical protein
MKIFSSVPAPASVKLVKALLLATGLIAVLGGIAAHTTGFLGDAYRVIMVIAGATSIVVALFIKHGYGKRALISGMLLLIGALQAVGVLITHQRVGLFGLLIPAALLLWINSPAARGWFAAPPGRSRGN